MRAVVCQEFGNPDSLAVSELDMPTPNGDEVLLKIEATGLGYVDALTVAGLYQIKPRLPFIPGNEVAGVIEQSGSDVQHLRAGQRVLATPSNGETSPEPR